MYSDHWYAILLVCFKSGTHGVFPFFELAYHLIQQAIPENDANNSDDGQYAKSNLFIDPDTEG